MVLPAVTAFIEPGAMSFSVGTVVVFTYWRDVRRLAGQQHLRQVGEVGVEEVRLGPGPQHRGERRRHLARVVVDAVDVMSGLAFSKMATSSSHSLCCTGCCAAGGAQSMLIVTLPPARPRSLPLAAELLEQAAAARTMPATAATATTGR